MSIPLLNVQNIVKDFDGNRALDGCTLEIPYGTITGLIGPNGAGKTTLFNIISGSIKSTSGEIFFKGERIDGLLPHQTFHKGIVRTFQIPRALQRMTVLENLLLIPDKQVGENLWKAFVLPQKVKSEEIEIRNRALEILEFVNLLNLQSDYAGSLSTGQKKLLELARTLMAKPELVLLDEPGAGVNPTLMNDLVGYIRHASKEFGVTFLLIEHDMNLVMELCNPIVVLNNGKNICKGPPETIQNDPLVLEAYLGGINPAV